MGDEKLIPVEEVLDDMCCNPNGGIIARAARDYYKLHYATPEERRMMDFEDNMGFICGVVFLVGAVLGTIIGALTING